MERTKHAADVANSFSEKVAKGRLICCYKLLNYIVMSLHDDNDAKLSLHQISAKNIFYIC